MDYRFYIAPLMLFVFTVISMVRLQIYRHRLMKHLRENHTEKWKYLTSIGSSGPGYVNSFRSLPFLLDNDDLEDPEVLRLKVIIRHCAIYILTGFAGAFMLFVVMAIISQKL